VGVGRHFAIVTRLAAGLALKLFFLLALLGQFALAFFVGVVRGGQLALLRMR
jgi:hypothetical protein